MMDVDCWKSIAELLSLIDHNKRPEVVGGGDEFGPLHLILFGDFKQELYVDFVCGGAWGGGAEGVGN